MNLSIKEVQMKNILGRFLLFTLFFISINSFASEYEWSVESSKNEAYVNEAISVKYT